MKMIDYSSREYKEMVAWTKESLEPYILNQLIPLYVNAYFSLILEPGGATHTRLLTGVNTTPTLALKEADQQQFGVLTAKLMSEFGSRLWMAKKPFILSEHQKVMEIRQSMGANAQYKW